MRYSKIIGTKAELTERKVFVVFCSECLDVVSMRMHTHNVVHATVTKFPGRCVSKYARQLSETFEIMSDQNGPSDRRS